MLSSIDPPIALTTDNCHTLPLESPITLYSPEFIPFSATAKQLTVIKGPIEQIVTDKSDPPAPGTPESGTPESGTPEPIPTDSAQHPQDCHLILSVSLAQYEQILEQSLFHLKPEVRGPLNDVEFLPDLPILVELGLQPHILALASAAHIEELMAVLKASEDLPSQALPHQDLPNFLQTLLAELPADFTAELPLSPSPSESPTSETLTLWQQTDSWLCRSVQQRQGEDTVGYATLWAYTAPEQTDPIIESGSVALDAIASLLQKTTDAVKTEVEQELPQIRESLSQFSDHFMTAIEQVDWEGMLSDIEEEAPAPVSEAVKQFFNEDDWAYVQLASSDPNMELLQLAFQGDEGRWTCLAQSNNTAEQVVFYSLCPITVPENSHGSIAELLMRANDGLIIGNFELDFSRGQIRYKTSLDVEGDRLTPALVKRLVYTNVSTLDTYLPGILAVLSGEQTPAAAIAALEATGVEATEEPTVESGDEWAATPSQREYSEADNNLPDALAGQVDVQMSEV